MKYLISIPLIFLCISVNAQSYQSDSSSIKDGYPTNWTTYISNENFEIEYRAVECDPSMGYDKEMILLRIRNRTNANLQFDWHMILSYGGVCKTCDFFDEYHYSVVVTSDSFSEGNCEIDSEYQLKIFSKFIDENYSLGDRLNSFELRNLTVQTQ